MSGTSYEGHAVNVGDQASIMGGVISISGSAPSTASVALQDLYGQSFHRASSRLHGKARHLWCSNEF